MVEWGTIHSDGINRFIAYPGFFQVAFATFNVVSKKFYIRFGFNVGQRRQDVQVYPEHKDNPEVGEVLNLGINTPEYIDSVIRTDDNIYRLEAGNFPSEGKGRPFLLRITDLEQENMFVKKYLIFNYVYKIKGMVFPQKWGGYFSSKDSSGKFEVDFHFTSFGAFSSEKSLASYLTSTSSLNWTRGNAEVFVIEIPTHLKRASVALYLKDERGKVDYDLKDILKYGYEKLQQYSQRKKNVLYLADNKEYVVLNKEETEEGEIKYRRLSQTIKRLDLLNSVAESLKWLRCYSPITRKFYYPVNREWIEMIARVFKINQKIYRYGPLQFLWDTSFLSIIASYFDVKLAEEILDLIFDYQDEKTGFIPQLVLGDKKNTISNPPIFFLAVWMLYKKTGEQEILKKYFPKLVKNFEWWVNNRDKDGDLLFQWGGEIDREGKNQLKIDRKFSAFFESGMDNSPLWENAVLDAKSNSLNLTTVDINSYINLNAYLLWQMAEILGETESSKKYQEFYQKQKDTINSQLWNEQLKMYGNKYLKENKFDYNYAPTSFYPFLSFIPDEKKANETIELNLTNHDMFWGNFLVPSISKNNIYFSPDGDYWGGRIWPPINYLLYLGCRNYSPQSAYEIALSSISMYEKEWSNEGHIHENYSAETGWGEPFLENYARSCPYYSWGGLLPLIFLEEVFGVELWKDGYHAGAMYHEEKVELLDYHFSEKLPPVSVVIYPPDFFQLKLGNFLIETNTMVELREISFQPKQISFKLCFKEESTVLKIKGMKEGRYLIKAVTPDSEVENSFKLTPKVGVSFEFSKKEGLSFQANQIILTYLEEEGEIYV